MKKIAFGIGCYLLLVVSSLQAKDTVPSPENPYPVCVFSLFKDHPHKQEKLITDVLTVVNNTLKSKKTLHAAMFEERFDTRGRQYCENTLKQTKKYCQQWRRNALIVSGLAYDDECNEIQKLVMNTHYIPDPKPIKEETIPFYVQTVDSFKVYKKNSTVPFYKSLSSERYPYFCVTKVKLDQALVADGTEAKLGSKKLTPRKFYINLSPSDMGKPASCDSVYSEIGNDGISSGTEDYIVKAIHIKDTSIKNWVNSYWNSLDKTTPDRRSS